MKPIKLAYLVVFIVGITASSLPAATEKQVDDAMRRAVAYLKAQQHGDNWEFAASRDPAGPPYSVTSGQWGGLSSLATFSLLSAGEDQQQPYISKSIAWLKKADIVGVYALGLRAQIWPMIPYTKEVRSLASADASALLAGINTRGKGRGLYNYFVTKKTPDVIDHSSSQIGVLGISACAQVGVEIPSNYWQLCQERWSSDQQPDGGWTYADPADNSYNNGGERPALTAAGVATLFITQDFTTAREVLACHGNVHNEHIESGLKWIADHSGQWAANTRAYGEPYEFSVPNYSLFGIERIGIASGLKYLGKVDWFQTGADYLISHQRPDGSWSGNLPDTALGLLFLARGRAPVVIEKLQYDNAETKDKKTPQAHWNERPRDAANLVHWIGKQVERDLSWQIVNLNVPVTELHDAPILYMAGNETISLTTDQEGKLRQFVEEGGLIVGSADCGQEAFNTSFTKLGQRLFPYEFRDLPATHPIFTNEQFSASKWKRPVVVRGLSNGVRELMLLLPTSDMPRSWQLQETAGHEEAFQLASNIVLYATDKHDLMKKGVSHVVVADLNIKPVHTARIARLRFAGNWNPEPAGWPRLAALSHNLDATDVTVSEVDPSKEAISPQITVAHLTGTGRFMLDLAACDNIKRYVNAGGTLLIDAAGGDPEFATAAEGCLRDIFGDIAPAEQNKVVSPDSAIYSAAIPKGTKPPTIAYRDWAKRSRGSLNVPQLKVIRVKGRLAVFFSSDDLSAGMVGEEIDGIVGYSPATAAQLVRDILATAVATKH